MRTVRAAIELDASPEVTFEAAVDWAGQREWVLASSVTPTSGGGRGVGATVEAVTGLGPLALRDPMQVTEWQPPARAVLRHIGPLVRGEAIYEVEALPGGRSRLVWAETLEPPGPLLAALYLVGTPVFGLMVRLSLRRFPRFVARRPHGDGSAVEP